MANDHKEWITCFEHGTKQRKISYYTAVSKLTMDRMELQHESSKLDEMEYMLAESQKKADDELSLIKRFVIQKSVHIRKHLTLFKHVAKFTTRTTRNCSTTTANWQKRSTLLRI